MPPRASTRVTAAPAKYSDETQLQVNKKKRKAPSTKKASTVKKAKKSSSTKKSSKKSSTKKSSTKKSPKASSSPKSASPSPSAKKSPKAAKSPKAGAAKKKSASKKSSTKKSSTKKSSTKKSPKKSSTKKSSTKKSAPASSSKKASSAAPKAAAASNPVTAVLQGMSIDALKGRLRANDQPVSGTKGELVARIQDCIKNGCLPRCPSCSGGRLKQQGGGYKCPGFYDDDHFRHCGYFAAHVARPAWQTEAGQIV